MTQLSDSFNAILDAPHVSVLATSDTDGKPQTSVILVKRDGDDVLFSTIKGRRKTTNMLANPRVSLLLYGLDTGIYATVSGHVELTDDPSGAFHQVMYDFNMGGAKAPHEPGAERVIVRIKPERMYVIPPYPDSPDEHMRAVVELHRETESSGDPVGPIARRWAVPRATASMWITNARNASLIQPDDA